MPGSTNVAAKNALYDRLAALTASGQPLNGVTVFDAYPNPQSFPEESVIVGDISGIQEPATMRSDGGRRDETYRIEIHVAVRRRTSEARGLRDRASAIAQQVETEIHNQVAGAGPPLGVAGLRHVLVRDEYDLREYLLDNGREADVRMQVECKARVPR